MPAPYHVTVFDPQTLRVMFQKVRVETVGDGGSFWIESDESVPISGCGLLQVPQHGPLMLIVWPVTSINSRVIHFKYVNQSAKVVVTPV